MQQVTEQFILPVAQADLTRWFDGDSLPAHVGYYERDWTVNQRRANDEPASVSQTDYWDGLHWHMGLMVNANYPLMHLDSKDPEVGGPRRWRGVVRA